MKHIARYNEYKLFESIDTLDDDINDILISELDDNNKFSCSIQDTNSGKWIIIKLSNNENYDGFKLGEIKPFLLRIKDYLFIKSGDSEIEMGVLVVGETERIKTIISEREIDKFDRWYNMVDSPGISNVSIRINMNNVDDNVDDNEYKVGDRIFLINMNDETSVNPGTEGTITSIDGIGQIHVDWDNGRTLALIPEIDEFAKVKGK